MNSPRYPKYKDSGVVWLADVPEHWTIKRLRFVAELNPSKSEIADVERDTEVSFLPMDSIGDDGSLNLEKTRPIQEVETGYTYFRDGDVTVAKITPCFENGKGALMRGLRGGIGFGTTELIVVRPKLADTSGDYLNWIFRSPGFRKEGEASMYGAGGQKRVPDDFVRNLCWAFPPLAEQFAIEAFLHRETGKIDALISEQERLLTLLAEKRLATISHAVTRGLNPDAPMKDSGVAWLGKVPAHWEITTIRRLAESVQTGGTPASGSPNGNVEDGIDWYTPGDFDSQLVLRDASRRVSNDLAAAGEVRIFPPNSILIVSIGATLGKVGLTNRLSSANQQINAVAFPQPHNARYFAYSLAEKSEVMKFLSNSSTIGIMNQEKTKDIVVAVPPIDEQLQIASFLDTKTAKFDALKSESERAIDLLREYRTALIAAAVTGKIDVRNAVPEELAA
ncbi:restriction endonuclease subunit S [Burkholderia gladioli]|uniref:restriction endonuclease subunit S n=1 Tax=Burkholderia gladioli TaxID=28095 RepID=UPI001916E5F6|nr:restriction endonuclease subunit S [Burkholderia gladioli]